MGYWINHSIRATGSKEDIDAYISKLTQRRPKELNDEGDIVWSEKEFSFYNIVSPPEEMIMDGSWWTEDGEQWRIKHWECYDAPAEDIDSYPNGLGKYAARISLSTKYDWPNNVFHELIEQYPKLEFSIWSEGEESEAVSIIGLNGLWDETHYDTPNSHADWVARDDEDNCLCANYDDIDDWYSDCPRPEPEEYTISATYVHRVMATSYEAAIEAVEAMNNGFDLPDNTKIVEYGINPIWDEYS